MNNDYLANLDTQALRERLEAAGKRLEEWHDLSSLQAVSYDGLKEVDAIMGEIYAVKDAIAKAL